MQLLDEKKAALKIIEQYNNAIKTCLEQNNISALQETYGLRSHLISDFFEKYSSLLNEDDQVFFDDIKIRDAGVLKAMQEVKRQVLSDVSSQNKTKKGINIYHNIANDE